MGELGLMVCLKKNLMGATTPGLVMGGPTLCCIRAWMNFRSIPGSKRLTMKATTRVPSTAIMEYVRFMVKSPHLYLYDLDGSISAGETGIALHNGKLSVCNVISNTSVLHSPYVRH